MANGNNMDQLNSLLKKMTNIQQGISEAEKKLEVTKFEGHAGGGEEGDEDSRCSVSGNGKFRIGSLKLGKRFIKQLGEAEAALLADLMLAAINDYCRKVQSGSGASIASMASEMGLPMDLIGDSGLSNLFGGKKE